MATFHQMKPSEHIMNWLGEGKSVLWYLNQIPTVLGKVVSCAAVSTIPGKLRRAHFVLSLPVVLVAYTPQFRTFLLATIYVGPKKAVGEGLGLPIFADRSRLEG